MADLNSKTSGIMDQAQAKKDEMVSMASGAAHSCQHSCQQGKDHAGSVLQQTGDQMKSMAQGAADAVKHATGK